MVDIFVSTIFLYASSLEFARRNALDAFEHFNTIIKIGKPHACSGFGGIDGCGLQKICHAFNAATVDIAGNRLACFAVKKL